MPRKIKVLDIIPENNENTPINDDVETVKETEQIEEKQEEVIEKQPETPTEIVEETTKTRVQQLVKCPKRGKMITEKTKDVQHIALQTLRNTGYLESKNNYLLFS